MASKLPVWGIDVGQCSLKALKLQASEDGVELVGFDLIEHKQILSQAESDASKHIATAIETFLSRNDLSNCRVALSVPGQQTLTRFTRMPPVEPKKLPSMVQYEAGQQIPFDMDEVVWDYQVFTESESSEVEVGIFAIRKELIRSHLVHFTDAGIEPFIVQASPMASYNAGQYELHSSDGGATILLDMGALATDLIVMENNRIWSRPVPIGGNRFTEALVSAFKIPFKKAERLKRNAAASKYARQIVHAMRPVFADLVSEVQRSIGFYTSTHREANITRVIGMGNAFKLPGLQKFLQQNLQIKVDKLGSFKRMKDSGIEKKAEFKDNVMSLAVCYGLALQGLGLAAVESNLLPLEVRRSLLWGKKRSWFAASAACLALAAGSIWVGNVMAKSELKKGIGNIDPSNIRIQSFPTAKAAMSAINSASGAPAERAVKIAGAAKKLKQEFNAAGRISGDEKTLKTLAKFPENNVFIPRIMDVIHDAFENVTPPELKTVRTADDYLRQAKQISRHRRKEVWIEKLDMFYSDDPGQAFIKPGSGDKVKRGKSGWAVQITGITTIPNPAKWLEENLIHSLLTLGRAPDRGLYFDTVKLGKVSRRGKPKSKSYRSGDSSGGNGRGDGRGNPGGRPGGGRPGGRPGGGGGGVPEPPGGWGGFNLPRRDSTVGLKELKKKYASIDPLTEEKVEKDYRFVLEVVIRKVNTPKAKIPESYKEKKAEPAVAAKNPDGK